MWEDEPDPGWADPKGRRPWSPGRRAVVLLVVILLTVVLCCVATREVLRLLDVIPPPGIPLLG